MTYAELQLLHPDVVERHESQSKQVTQKNDEWRKRTGCITSSKAADLMTSTCKFSVGKTSEKYIFEKVYERITGQECDNGFSSAATEWGKKYEPEAAKLFEEKYNCTILDKGDDQKFYKVSDMDVGATPDGILEEEWFDGTAEIKCPFNGANHLQNILCRHNVQKFKKTRFEYYVQVQIAMWSSGKNKTVFISYDPRQKEHLKLYVITIPIDLEFIDELKIVIGEAIARRDEAVRELTQYKLEWKI